MNKKTVIIMSVLIAAVVIIIALVLFVGNRQSAKLSPRKSTEFSYNGLDISVSYGQPSKRGRLIFGPEKDGALQPFGKYWRLGANEATEITFSKDVLFEGNPLKAGTYRMYAVPGDSVWQVGLNSELGAWGAGEPDYDRDVLKVNVRGTDAPDVTEQFIIDFKHDSTSVWMVFNWDQARVPVRIGTH